MNFSRVTRNPSATTIDPLSSTTEFQLRRARSVRSNVYDISERRLETMIDRAVGTSYKERLVIVHDEYVRGRIAIAWRRGEPVFVYVTRD